MSILETKLLNKNQIAQAAHLIQNGEVVSFPTDTVYGIGADARNEAAVAKIFKAKMRPADRPLSVLIGKPTDIFKYTAHVPAEAVKLAETFWPGPLTIILEHNQSFAPVVTAGMDTVGLRMPDHPVALALLAETDIPLATPSANLSGRPSPTQASHVMEDLTGRIPAIIDGGETSSGIESTVIDFSNPEKPLLLRPGTISQAAIEATINKKVYLKEVSNSDQSSKQAEKHYQPKIPVYMVESNWTDAIQKMNENDERVAILANHTLIEQYEDEVVASFSLGDAGNSVQASRHLFEGLRALEKSQATVILAEIIINGGLSAIYMNRLENAANFKIL